MNHIIHMDIDAFFASVEELDNPYLKNKCIVVGGLSKSSIVTTANYNARKFGIHSAMPIFLAKELCPDLIVVPLRMEKYLKKSKEVFNIVCKYSNIVEKVSIDEAYIDIIDSPLNSMDLIHSLRNEIKEKTGLVISVGLSYNKFLAKIASDWNKPNGIKIISENEVPNILKKLDIRKVHGIGSKSEKKLKKIGINTIEDMLYLTKEFLEEKIGKNGSELYYRIRGIDNRKVITFRKRKSIGNEKTFSPTNDINFLLEVLDEMAIRLRDDLNKENISCRTLMLKIKTDEFIIHTKSKTLDKAIKDYNIIKEISMEVFTKIYKNENIRLLGITGSNLVSLNIEQLSFLN